MIVRSRVGMGGLIVEQQAGDKSAQEARYRDAELPACYYSCYGPG